MLIIFLVWFAGYMVTSLLLLWAVQQPISGETSGTQAVLACALWFITLPLAAIIVVRLRYLLSWLRAVEAGDSGFLRVEVKLIVPPKRNWLDWLALRRRLSGPRPPQHVNCRCTTKGTYDHASLSSSDA